MQLTRAYYRCRHCRCGVFPFDQRLRLNQRKESLAVRELAALAGVEKGFGKAAGLLKKTSGVCLSESTEQRLTEEAGQTLKSLQDQQVPVGQPEPWCWHPDREGHRCGYVSIDATGVRQQGAKGEKQEARMANVARLYTAKLPEEDNSSQNHRPAEDQPPRVDKSRFFAGHCSLEDLRHQVQQAAKQVGSENTSKGPQRWICLSDGGSGLEQCLKLCFAFTVVILDYWHAREYLVNLAKVLFPGQDAQREDWVAQMSHRLKHQGGEAVKLLLQNLRETETGTAAREELNKVIGYYQNHQHKMNYPEYRAKGWQIGSGAVESACKQVVNERLDGSGMRWREQGSDAICRLRALACSDPLYWDAFWAQAG